VDACVSSLHFHSQSILAPPQSLPPGLSNFVLLLLETIAKPQSPIYAIAVLEKHINAIVWTLSPDHMKLTMDSHTSLLCKNVLSSLSFAAKHTVLSSGLPLNRLYH